MQDNHYFLSHLLANHNDQRKEVHGSSFTCRELEMATAEGVEIFPVFQEMSVCA